MRLGGHDVAFALPPKKRLDPMLRPAMIGGNSAAELLKLSEQCDLVDLGADGDVARVREGP
jgi:hypothetical protein